MNRGNSKNYGKRKNKRKENRHISFMEKLYNTSSRRSINRRGNFKLSETKKKELLKTLNKCDTIMGKMSKSYTKDLKVDPKTLLNEKEIISKNKEENKEEEKDYGEERDDK